MKTMVGNPLNDPQCLLGYPEAQLEREMTVTQLRDFYKFMNGQTFSLCDGRSYDHDLREYVETGCGPHGYVFYRNDVERFLQNLPVID